MSAIENIFFNLKDSFSWQKMDLNRLWITSIWKWDRTSYSQKSGALEQTLLIISNEIFVSYEIQSNSWSFEIE